MRHVLRSKIHNDYVTEANLAYIGSITIDEALMEAVGLWEGERVLVVSNTSGHRLETYVITGERDSGIIAMNGAAAHLINESEQIIILGHHDDRIALARDFGSTDVVPERGDAAIARVKELTDGYGAHAVLECVGLDQSMETAVGIARPGGAVGRV